MGMLGGLGRGMQMYAGTMANQRKLDWEAQQADLRHQRAMNLESLRAQNASNEGALNREFQKEMQDDKQAFSGEQTAAAQAFAIGEREAGQEFQMEKMEKQQKLTDASTDKRISQELQMYKDKLGAKKEMEDKITQEQLAVLEESEAFKKMSPEDQDFFRMGIRAGGSWKISDLNKAPKGLKAATGAQIKQAREMLADSEAYQNAGDSAKIMMVTMQAAKFANPGSKIGGTKRIREDQLVQSVEDFRKGKMTAFDLMALEPESLSMLMQAVSSLDTESKPTQPLRTPEMGQGQAYMKEQTQGMFSGIKSGYEKAKSGMAARRAGQVPITNPRR